VAICKGCGDEREQHARMHKHCRVRAGACLELLAALKSQTRYSGVNAGRRRGSHLPAVG
jgi:hypothetical protein